MLNLFFIFEIISLNIQDQAKLIMKELKVKRELRIENKIFTIANLTDLIRLFIKHSIELENKSAELKRRELVRKGLPESVISEGYLNSGHSDIALVSEDNSKFNFSSGEVEEAIGILKSKRIKEIELIFIEKTSETRFAVKLRQSGSFSDQGYVLLESDDVDWMNACIKGMEEFLFRCKNQTVFIKKNKILIIVLIIAILSFFLLNLIEFFIKTEVSFPKIVGNIFRDDLIYYIILFVMVTATPSVLIYRWLRKLFPSIEIQTGPQSGKVQKEKRNKLLLIVLILIISVMISILIR
jgi:hypothetical protein